MGRLEGKAAVVTAAGQGIGRQSVIFMAQEGATVWATDVRLDMLEKLVNDFPNLSIHIKKVDVTNQEDVNALAAEVKSVDILFNCAGWVHQGSIMDCTNQDFQRSYEINVRGMFWMCQAFIPKISDGGSIINMSSVASSIKGAPNRFAYGTTKAAVIGLTKSIAADLVDRKIRVNAICPGTVHTPSWEDRVQDSADPEEAKKNFIARQKMGRLGTAEEIAHLVVYLSADESAYTTGTAQVIDGGWSI